MYFICKMKEDIQIRTAIFTEEFKTFLFSSNDKVKVKCAYIIEMIETQKVLTEKFIKKLQNTEFYEMRISVGFNEYRTILFSINAENIIQATEIVFLNSFLKKDTKDYKKAIEEARKILENFLKDKDNE